ncbi:NAD-dependent epimerase/dehydratase family protein [Polaribacter sp. Z022]|uniref:NAD-dependent epimerase/dehydratase family protein n=1 Tax=Polaribacter sp. Z022 TaxID=2927125 RepID=UPI002020C474|nr:NAD-dependent epimerase/dehydratase family protein [Polaribacter sp. Z022]MCL7754807.1 NAD-dependent epimerase/dehydratase family protein [Polaribacter sp. Z022]
MDIAITGASGFVGGNLKSFLEKKYNIYPLSVRYAKGQKITLNQDVIVHLSGKAHDLKSKSNSLVYEEANFKLTKQLFDSFLKSKECSVFIFISSVKAVADSIDEPLTELIEPLPKTDYGISKLNAEKYILNNKNNLLNKRVFIIRPCMIHGPNNKGNLNLMYNIVAKKIPWPLGSFNNKRSFLGIDNFNFVIDQIIKNEAIKSDVFNLSDDTPLSTNDLVRNISEVIGVKIKILNIPKTIIKIMSILGDFLRLPINSERLQKLTENYVVSNKKIKKAIGKELPYSVEQGLIKTIESFKLIDKN